MVVYITITHAPVYSAYNYVEQRMASLNRTLADLVLPHDSCGTNLDDSEKKIDIDLEKQNFKTAGGILFEIWGKLTLNDQLVVAVYSEDETLLTNGHSERWVTKHCRISQYMLQVAR